MQIMQIVEIQTQKQQLIIPQTPNQNNILGIDAEKQTYKISHVIDDRFSQQIKKFQRENFDNIDLSELFKDINDQDIIKQHYGAIGIRKKMSVVSQPPIQSIIDSGIIPRLIQLTSQDQYPQLQLQATWSLANVASGTSQQCSSIINNNGIEIFVKLLQSKYPGIIQQAIWALGNIASDSTSNRDSVIRRGGISNIIHAISVEKLRQLRQPGAWALSNLCRTPPLPDYQLIKQAIIFLAQVLTKQEIKDSSVFSDCCWSISQNFPTQPQQYQRIINKQFISTLTQKLRTENISILVPVLKVLRHITKISDYYADMVLLNSDIIGSCYDLLYFQRRVVRSQTCMLISNIARGPQRHINLILANQNLEEKLLQMFHEDTNPVKTEICYVFKNMIERGNPQIILRFLKEINIMRFYVQALSSGENILILNALQCIYQVLEFGQKHIKNSQNSFVSDLINLGAQRTLEQLQLHESQKVYRGTIKIMERFFTIEES